MAHQGRQNAEDEIKLSWRVDGQQVTPIEKCAFYIRQRRPRIWLRPGA